MSAAERAFFEGDHCQHVAARDEHLRLNRKYSEAVQALRSRTQPTLRVVSNQETPMLGHPIGCVCPDCAGPIVLDARRVTLGFLGLCIVAVWLWLGWIMLPA
jgi:hypothetical protein